VNCTVRCPTNMDTVATEPYLPAYYMINGRSMPDDMDPNYSTQYPHQPYNGNPHMHPGELTLLRIVGRGAGSTPSMSTVTTYACWPVTATCCLRLARSARRHVGGPLMFTTRPHRPDD